jgi:hypothetical protein
MVSNDYGKNKINIFLFLFLTFLFDSTRELLYKKQDTKVGEVLEILQTHSTIDILAAIICLTKIQMSLRSYGRSQENLIQIEQIDSFWQAKPNYGKKNSIFLPTCVIYYSYKN